MSGRTSWLLFKRFPMVFRFEGNQLWKIILKGSAFLWHQVRCMVAILFMVGQGIESPDVRMSCPSIGLFIKFFFVGSLDS